MESWILKFKKVGHVTLATRPLGSLIIRCVELAKNVAI